ncbi:MAG: hypothetical protein AAFP03_13635 [Cyanobacteria bacterium J06598_3]
MPSFLRKLLSQLGILPAQSAGQSNHNSISSTAPRQANAKANSPHSDPLTDQLAGNLAGTLPDQPPSDLPNDLQQEIRANRKFSLAEAIGRESAGFMKGESAIPRPLRATNAIRQFITAHLSDPTSALSTTLQSWATEDIRVSRHLDTPLVALSQILESILGEPTTFCEFARQVAIAHAHLTGDRPHFQALGARPHPEATRTHEDIQSELAALLTTLQKNIENYAKKSGPTTHSPL